MEDIKSETFLRCPITGREATCGYFLCFTLPLGNVVGVSLRNLIDVQSRVNKYTRILVQSQVDEMLGSISSARTAASLCT